MTFHVGQKVVCIRNVNVARARFGETLPVKGEIYTIRAILVDPDDGESSLMLSEIRNLPQRYSDGYVECYFHSEGFRPVVERKTDISTLTALLVPAVKVRESV